MTTTKVPDSKCRNCGTRIGAATHGDDASPSPFDISVCAYCRTVSIFDEDLMLREPTDNEWAEIAGHPDLARYVDAAAASNFVTPKE